MAIRNLFVTRLYQDALDDPTLITDLERSCRALARDDGAGRAWSKANGYPGYTSYASLNDLPMRDPVIAHLKRGLDRHIQRFAVESFMDIGRRKLKLDSLWVNILKPGGSHSGHLHPHSIVSGTFYVCVPAGSGRLKLEDPRLPMMMAAPQRAPDAPEDSQPFVYADPLAGTILLWESWLRHEVMAGTAKSERISISFNYS
ncbi:MAG: hypothetical protein JF564_00870 [Sphingomonas sp.]|nr:hypothetical protein [Sphingomonas sp.]